MEYILAKQLKDAGFYQGFIGGYHISTNEIFALSEKGINFSEYIKQNNIPYIPTLSELIDNCGDDFAGLIKLKNLFYAGRPGDKMPYADKLSIGYKTPEEAVARLWLALNEK